MAPDHMVIVFLPESTRLNDVMPRPQAKAPK
ncbi:spermidine/putrescine ABC transporter ATP-binding protein, partial [Klebsiella pneumoniae]